MHDEIRDEAFSLLFEVGFDNDKAHLMVAGYEFDGDPCVRDLVLGVLTSHENQIQEELQHARSMIDEARRLLPEG